MRVPDGTTKSLKQAPGSRRPEDYLVFAPSPRCPTGIPKADTYHKTLCCELRRGSLIATAR